jgi:beta-mannosidase
VARVYRADIVVDALVFCRRPGTSFYFCVNDVPIYIKGANMIPASAFHTRTTDFNISLQLQSLLETGTNTVRVWGGGIYARDFLYEYADANGLLGGKSSHSRV